MEEIRRLPPCPDYDIEGRQAWLEDMAREGYVLTGFGRYRAIFKKTTPKQIRYRLQPLQNKKEAKRNEIALAEEFGWTHLGNHGYFAVYGTEDPNARELHTDPQVHALAIGQMLRTIITTYLVVLLLYSPILWLAFRTGPLVFLTENTLLLNWLVPITLLLTLWIIGSELVHFFRLKQKLRLGQAMTGQKDWKQGKYRHQALFLTHTVLCFAVILAAYCNTHLPWETYRWKPVEEPLPFATLEDLAPDSRYEIGDWFMENNNEIAVRSTLLVREQLKYLQCGYLYHPDGTASSCWYTVDSFDMRTEALADALFRQLQNHAELIAKDVQTPSLPAKQACFYAGSRPTLLLQHGTQVLKFQLNQSIIPDDTAKTHIMPDEQWITAAAAK